MNGEPLILRADTSETIGTGHVMRCLAIAQEWRARGGRVVFVVRLLPPAMEARLTEEGFDCKRIAADTDAGDIAETLSYAKTLGAAWIGVDCPKLKLSYQREVKSGVNRLLLIDDYPTPGHYSADLVVNTDLSPQDEELYADRAGHTRLLLGPEYALLRQEFFHIPPAPRSSSAIPRVLITFGGSDPENMTAAVLGALLERADRTCEVRAVIGNSNPNLAALQQFAGQHGRVSVEIMAAVRQMAALMRWADVAVLASGIAVWELLYLGIPCLCWPRHDFDARNLAAFEAMGALAVLPRRCAPQEIAAAILWLTQDAARTSAMSKIGPRLVDGRGVARILSAMAARDARGSVRA